MVKLAAVKKALIHSPRWIVPARPGFLEEENALLFEQRGALRDELKAAYKQINILSEKNATLREANRQLRELIAHIDARMDETEQRFKEAQNEDKKTRIKSIPADTR